MNLGVHNVRSRLGRSKVKHPSKSLPGPYERELIYPVAEMIQVACNQKKKGDRLIRSGRSILATSVYQSALKKLQMLDRNYYTDFMIQSDTFRDYTAPDAMKALTFKLQAGLAEAGLMSQQYIEVARLADSALKCKNEVHDTSYGCHGSCSLSYKDDHKEWTKDQREDYVKFYYCKAMSLYHMGDTLNSKEHMEIALGWNPWDHRVKVHLVMLKRKLAKEEFRRSKLQGLNDPQKRLYKKQTLRRAKV